MNTISILGCGWLGLPLGKSLAGRGYQVCGSTTREAKLPLIQAAGIEAFLIKVGGNLEGDRLSRFFQSEVLVLNIPLGRRQPDVEERFPRQIQLIADAAVKHGLKKILFISSTGVHGNDNKVVRETDEVAPQTASGRALVATEEILRQQKGLSLTILRLAGLIGGERHPGNWFAGKKDLEGGSVPVNLVHREDCIRAITAIIEQEKWGALYQLCADEHPRKEDFYPRMSRQLGLEPPTYKAGSVVPFKVISNEKIKRELNLELKYPDPMTFEF